MIQQIIIKTDSENSMCKVRDSIHKQLKGNQDYIDSEIVLFESPNEQSKNEVGLWFSEKVKDESEILKMCLKEL